MQIDEAWPLMIEDHLGIEHAVTMGELREHKSCPIIFASLVHLVLVPAVAIDRGLIGAVLAGAEPGEMVLYESARLVHGRPLPLNGSTYAPPPPPLLCLFSASLELSVGCAPQMQISSCTSSLLRTGSRSHCLPATRQALDVVPNCSEVGRLLDVPPFRSCPNFACVMATFIKS